MSLENKWSQDRRRFIKKMAVIGLASQIGFIQACTENSNLLNEISPFFDKKEVGILRALMEVLFPSDGNGPTINDISAYEHIVWSLKDELFGYNPYKILKQSLVKLNTYSESNHELPFVNLNEKEQHKVVTEIVKLDWGEKLASKILTYIFEALSIDPLYNVNTDKKGWAWLGHQPGFPRPEIEQLYPKFIIDKYENI